VHKPQLADRRSCHLLIVPVEHQALWLHRSHAAIHVPSTLKLHHDLFPGQQWRQLAPLERKGSLTRKNGN
jgi:hypothetical protein